MKRRRLGLVIGLAMTVQVATAGITWFTAMAESASAGEDGRMCGGSRHSFASDAPRNTLETNGLVQVGSGTIAEISSDVRAAKGSDLP